jgi:tagatose 6-phosphate kinase
VILVVALNPALDITHRLDHVDWAGVNRPAAVHVSPGGKGLNVARVLRALGADVLLTALAGGQAGNVVRSALSDNAIPACITQTSGETRRTFAVVDTGRGETAIFNEPGPRILASEYAAFLDCYAGAVARSSAVVLSGSLPPGLPVSAYADLIRLAADAGVPSLLDTSGPALTAGLAAGPAVVMPNLDELETAAGRPLRPAGRDGELAAAPPAGDREPGRLEGGERYAAVVQAAGQLRRAGAGAAVVTLGADGLLAVTGSGCWHAAAPPASGNPTGAGDAAAAGLALGMAAGTPWPERLAQAAALGAAAVAAPVAGQFDPADYDRALAAVQVTSWELP